MSSTGTAAGPANAAIKPAAEAQAAETDMAAVEASESVGFAGEVDEAVDGAVPDPDESKDSVEIAAPGRGPGEISNTHQLFC